MKMLLDDRAAAAHPRTQVEAGPLRTVIMLAGSVRPSRLVRAIERPLLDLPITERQTVLQRWQQHLEDLAAALALPSLTARVMIDQSTPLPQSAGPAGRATLRVEHDPRPFRGTAGVLHDLTRGYDEDERVLVVHGSQLLLEPLPRLVEALTAGSADVTLMADRDNAPVGVMLVRCGALRQVASVGFADFKEQALRNIAKRHRVEVLRRPGAAALALRTTRDYLHALRALYLAPAPVASSGASDTFAEDWMPRFSMVEAGARVHESARVHDAVVLAGAEVRAEATVVRSVVCPGAVVRRGATVVERLVTRRDEGTAESAI